MALITSTVVYYRMWMWIFSFVVKYMIIWTSRLTLLENNFSPRDSLPYLINESFLFDQELVTFS